MIRFEGNPTDEVKKLYLKNARKLGHKIVFISWLLLLPLFINMSFHLGRWGVLAIYLLLVDVFHLLICCFRSKSLFMSKVIYIEDEYITALGDGFEEIRCINDAKCVIDHGGFYELVFPFGKVSDKFICQKSLLVQGSLEEFEALFKDKLRRKV